MTSNVITYKKCPFCFSSLVNLLEIFHFLPLLIFFIMFGCMCTCSVLFLVVTHYILFMDWLLFKTILTCYITYIVQVFGWWDSCSTSLLIVARKFCLSGVCPCSDWSGYFGTRQQTYVSSNKKFGNKYNLFRSQKNNLRRNLVNGHELLKHSFFLLLYI